MRTQKDKKENQQTNAGKQKDPLRAYLIRCELIKRKITNRKISKELEICESMVSMCIAQDRRNVKFDEWVRENLGLAV